MISNAATVVESVMSKTLSCRESAIGVKFQDCFHQCKQIRSDYLGVFSLKAICN